MVYLVEGVWLKCTIYQKINSTVTYLEENIRSYLIGILR